MPFITKKTWNRRRRISAARRIQSKWRSRGPTRGYAGGYSRFGRIAQPEFKSKVLLGRADVSALANTEVVIFPTISQGITEDSRLGNRICSKYLNVRVLFTTLTAQPAAAARTCMVRYVMWQSKDPTTNANLVLGGLNLTSFINTKVVKVLKTGYINMTPGHGRVLKINYNCKNKVVDFREDTDVTANTTQRIYFTFFTTEGLRYEFQSKFYFSDP